MHVRPNDAFPVEKRRLIRYWLSRPKILQSDPEKISKELLLTWPESLRREDVVDRITRTVRQLAARHGLRQSDADDLVQDTMLAILKNADKYDATRGAPWPWVAGIARIVLASRLRESHRKAMAPLPSDLPAEDDFKRIWDEEFASAWKAHALQLLRSTKMDHKTVMVGSAIIFNPETDTSEIAKRFNVTSAYVHTATKRVRDMLAKSLKLGLNERHSAARQHS